MVNCPGPQLAQIPALSVPLRHVVLLARLPSPSQRTLQLDPDARLEGQFPLCPPWGKNDKKIVRLHDAGPHQDSFKEPTGSMQTVLAAAADVEALGKVVLASKVGQTGKLMRSTRFLYTP